MTIILSFRRIASWSDALHKVQGDADMAMFTNVSVSGVAAKSVTKELDDYLRNPVEDVSDVLKWWWDRREAYPVLSRMARDYLSVPGEYSSL